MTNRLIGIYDGLTDTYIERLATDEEQAEIDAREAKAAAEELEAKTQEEQLKATKIAAYEKLGLTEAEIKVLLPAPQPKNTELLGGN